MLTLEENGWNFKTIKIYSFLNIFPIEIDMKSGKIHNQNRRSNKIRSFLWNVLFGFAISHLIFMLFRLFQSTILEPEKYFRWDHFIIHFPSTVAYVMNYYTGFRLFVKTPGENVIVFNQLFVEGENPVQKMMEQETRERELQKKSGRGRRKKVSVSPSDGDQNLDLEIQENPESGTRVRPLLTWPPQYSLDEILARTVFLMIQETVFVLVIILAVDPTRPQLLYSSLPPEFQNMYSFLGLLAVEAVFETMVLNFACFSVVCQLLFFGKCQAEFKQMDLQLRNLKEKFQNRLPGNRDLKKEIWILRQILKEMKQLEVFIELFNRCFPPCIFAWKLLCFACAILSYFFTIRHFQDFPLLAAFTGYTAIILTFTYGILYEKAFSIPEKMEEMKNEFLLTVDKTTTSKSMSKPKPEPKPKSTAAPARVNTRLDFDASTLESFGAEMEREIGAIRDVGVKVGSFHTLERESTPNFVDFVFQNVVDLLVTFPR